MICWHKWSKWTPFKWHGYYLYRWGTLAGQKHEAVEDRQRRTCEKCGKTQEEKLNTA